jgi:peptidoglycan/LPS O-acetylase OafA/YrhL
MTAGPPPRLQPSWTSNARLDGLTTLRFFAAFYVFLFHFNLRVPFAPSDFISNIVSNGATITAMWDSAIITYHASREYTRPI